MQYSETFREGPYIDDESPGEGAKKGHYYKIFKEWKTFDDDDELILNCWSDEELWIIYPDGTLYYQVNQDTARFGGFCPGTFNSSRYEAFVEMMKNFKTEWMDELQYDNEAGCFSSG